MVAVAAPEGDLDEGVPWHYGDPMVESGNSPPGWRLWICRIWVLCG